MRTAVVLFLAGALCAPAWATLGQGAASVRRDQQQMRAKAMRSLQRQGYSVQQLRSASGVQVREYLDPDGHVFAVAWNGPVHPNLQQLLGTYFGAFKQAMQQRTRVSRGPVEIRVGDMVVQLGGHMRALFGRAILVSQMPANVSREVVR